MGRIENSIHFVFPEGATPITDCSGLIPNWVHTLKDLNRLEAENIMNAQEKYLYNPVSDPKNWFHVKELKKIHRSMFVKVWEWAGDYRRSFTSIGIKPSLIPIHLAEFCLEVASWSEYPTELTFVEMAARIHHRLVFISVQDIFFKPLLKHIYSAFFFFARVSDALKGLLI